MSLTTPTMHTAQVPPPSSAWTGWGQWLAVIAMTVDHVVRYLLLPGWDVAWASSSIGRIAFPLFAAMVAWHGLFNTRDPLRYARRILIIGLLAQLPYMALPRDGFQLNICFTLALGLVWGTWLLGLAQRSGQDGEPSLQTALAVVGSLLIWLLLGPWLEYQHAGLLLVPCYMLALQALSRPADTLIERMGAALAALPALFVTGLLNISIMANTFAVGTCLLMLWVATGGTRRVPPLGFKMPRRLWLAWYPAHLAVIVVVRHWPSG